MEEMMDMTSMDAVRVEPRHLPHRQPAPK